MYQRGELRSQALDLLRFPLAVCIVVIHAFPAVRMMETFGINPVDSPILVAVSRYVFGSLDEAVVPIFFFISGLVFFINYEPTRETYIRKLKNRAKTLLVPYLIWNALPIVILVAKDLLIPGIHDWDLHPTLPNLLSCFWNYNTSMVTNHGAMELANYLPAPINNPLWFVKDLIVVVLFTPLIYWVLKRTKYFVITLLGILWFADRFFDFNLDNQFFLCSFFFFSLGAYMSINSKDILAMFGRFSRLSMVMYPLLAVVQVATVDSFPACSKFIMLLNVLVGLLFAYNLSAWFLKKKICNVSPMLASSSFFIYVSHSIVFTNTKVILLRMTHPSSDLQYVCFYTVIAILTVLLLLAIFCFLKRYCPVLLNLLTGRK